MTTLRNKILKANDIQSEKVSIPEWGVDVYIRSMTGADRDLWEKTITGKNGDVNVRAKLVVFTAVDEDGKRIFADADISLLAEKSSKVLTRLSDIAVKLNGLSPDDVDEAIKN